MNILSISSILPVTGYRKTNDFVFEFYDHYLHEFNHDHVAFILPIKYSNRLIKIISNDKSKENEIRKLKKFHYNDFEINILIFLSLWRLYNVHAILSHTLFFFNIRLIDQLIKKNKIDVVHAQYIFPDGMLAFHIWKKYKIPYIITSHNELRYFRHFISKRLALRVLKYANRITPLNFSSHQTFIRNNLNNSQLIPLGFDEKFLESGTEKKHEEIRIITVANLIKLKNIDKVIHALYRLSNKYNFIYTIVGEGPEKDFLNSLINQYHLQTRIQLLGKIPHNKIADILSEHDIFIMPSYYETFGRAYFEAMAMKIPIICAKNSGIYGFFEEMKEGISVDHENIDDIANKLEILISDSTLRKQIGNNGHRLVKNYTWKNLAIKYKNIYNETTFTEF